MNKLTKEQRRAKRKKQEKERQKKQRSKERAPRAWEAVKMKLFKLSNPFEGIPKEGRFAILKQITQSSEEDFQNSYIETANWLKKYDPLYILSYCAMYFSSHPEGIDPEASGKLDFPPFLLELMQALALTDTRTFSIQPLLNDGVALKDLLKKLGNSMKMRFSDITELTTDEEFHAQMLRQTMMASTTAIRNWAYFHQMKRVCIELSTLVDSEFQSIYGVGASIFVNALFELVESRNDKLNEYLEKIRGFFKLKDYSAMLRAYNSAFPENIQIQEDQFEEIWKMSGKRIKSLAGLLVSHAELKMLDIYSISKADVIALAKTKIERQKLWDLFQAIAYKFGDLKESNKQHFILSNPVSRKPFIIVNDTSLFSAIWGVIPHYALTIFEDFIWSHESLKKKYTTVKSKYLEEEVCRIFANAFPSAQLFTGSFWKDKNGVKYENDLTVVIDSFAIVVEAKSATISDPAKRGAPDRLSETLRHLIEEPSEQALRFINLLSNNPKAHVFTKKNGEINEINSTGIKYYIPIGITFSHLGTIGSNLKNLIDAKITKKTLEQLAPSMSFTDLEIVFDLLESEAERVHYLSRRREFEAHMKYEGDELDLLGFYLDNGFNIGDTEYAQDFVLNMGLKSKELDPYIIGRSEGILVTKPRLQMSDWWRDMLNRIQERKSEGWLESCFVLLNSTKDDQDKFEKSFKKLIIGVKNGTLEKAHNWVVFASGPERRRYFIVGYPYTTPDKEIRNSIINEILADSEDGIRGALVIGIDVNVMHYPYSVLARRLSTSLFDILTLPPKAMADA